MENRFLKSPSSGFDEIHPCPARPCHRCARNDKSESPERKDHNNKQEPPAVNAEQTSIAGTEASFPKEFPWGLEDENIDWIGNKNILAKGDWDEITTAQKITCEEKRISRSNEKVKDLFEHKGKAKNVNTVTGLPIQVDRDSNIENSPCLMYFDGEEGELITPRPVGITNGRDNTKVLGPDFITIDDVEEEAPCNVTRPGAVSVNGPNALARPTTVAEANTNTNNPMTAVVENVHAVPEATLVDDSNDASKFSRGRRLLFVMFGMFITGAIIFWQLIPGGNASKALPSATTPPSKINSVDAMRQLISSVSPSSIQALNNTSSAQYNALQWIVADSANESYLVPKIIQRWVLATLFYSTSGEDWINSNGWLSKADECNWNSSVTFCGDTDNITELNLIRNNLYGSIPPELGLLSASLIGINFQKNFIRGSIPTEIGELTLLTSLTLGENDLGGSMPSQIGMLSSIVSIFLNDNSLIGSIPEELWPMADQSLEHLSLKQNQFTGSIPSKMGTFSKLQCLNIQENQLRGTIPTEIGLLPRISSILLGYNQFTGTVPTEISFLSDHLTFFDVSVNPLVGTLPTELGLLTKCDTLKIHTSSMTNSKLPSELGLMKRIEELNFDKNSITGNIPTEVGLLNNLIFLSLAENDLEGEIPSEIGLLTNLEQLYLSKNQLSGTIPSTLGNMYLLLSLWIFNNGLIGPVPDTVCDLRNRLLTVFAADCDELICPETTCCTSCF